MFTSTEFKDSWDMWKKHKQEQSGYPYTATAESMALSALFKMSHGIEDLAIASIIYSMENNWAKVYIKPKEHGNRQNNGSSKPINGKQGGTSTDRVEALRNW